MNRGRCIALALVFLVPVGAAFADPDGDGDGVTDSADNCPVTPNTDQVDGETAHFPDKRVVATDTWIPHRLVAADLDGDGDEDMVVGIAGDFEVGQSSSLRWYEHLDGAGAFGPAQVLATTEPMTTVVAATDVNETADLDLIGIDTYLDLIVWYENSNGTGEFVEHHVELNVEAVFLDAGDLDGDGDADLLVWVDEDASPPSLHWYENVHGDGSTWLPRLIGGSLNGAQTVDLDGDLDLDVLISRQSDIQWRENLDGTGNFGPAIVIASTPSLVTTADLDGDADPDILFRSDSLAHIGWVENLGGGAFGPAQIAVADTGPSSNHPLPPLIAADLDVDGDLDLAFARDGLLGIRWSENLDGAGSFGPARVVVPDALAPWSLLAVDIDQDGRADLVSGESDHGVWWYPNRPDGVGNACDNCSAEPNFDQADADVDGTGDVCDACTDLDGDGFGNLGFAANSCPTDNCPELANSLQLDADGDGRGNVCDNCPAFANAGQEDGDADGAGDGCDVCPLVADALQANSDSDALGDACDNCPTETNPGQQDGDFDEVGNGCDNCLVDHNPPQIDLDDDLVGDACDLDDGSIAFERFSSTEVRWQDEAGFPGGWNLYRGALSALLEDGLYTQAPGSNALAARWCNLELDSFADTDTPAAGEVAFYLVTGTSHGVESTLGTDSAGTPRPNAFPCPP